MTNKHIHADLMMEYAKDAMETDKPWERWEYYDGVYWVSPDYPMAFDKNYQYRRKKKTININGFEVPEPVREFLKVGTKFYSAFDYSFWSAWNGDKLDCDLLEAGVIHLDRESAELHQEALLSFTKQK